MIREQSIDLVKIIAMMGVICLHTILVFDFSNTITGHIIFSMAGFSMPLFFMVSGYLMLGRNRTWFYFLSKCFNILRFVVVFIILYDLLKYRANFNLELSVMHIVQAFFHRGPYSIFWYFGSILFLYLVTPLFDNILRKPKYIYYVLICLLFIVSITYGMNLTTNFENGIFQSCRMWNWLLYYFLGYLVRILLHNIEFDRKLYLKILGGIAYVAYVVFFYAVKDRVGSYGVEFLFGSLPCILGSILIFTNILSIEIKGSQIIDSLSNLFLPVYAIHMSVISIVFRFNQKFDILDSPILCYFSIALLTLSISYVIMKLPFVRKLFTI